MTAVWAMERRTAVCAAGNWIPVGSARTRVRQIRHALLNQLVQTESQFPPTGGERVQSAVSRKSSKLNHTCDRTAHRHRWSGREDQDERVRGPQGTRQKSGRKLAIRPSRPFFGKSGTQLKFFWQLFTKNTAPCKLVRGSIGGDT